VPATANRIVEFVKRTRIFTAMTGMLTPVPHTPLFERLRREGRLLPAEYSGNNTDDEVQFVPRGMTVNQMYEGIHRILASLFNRAESYRRALDMLRSVEPHLFSRRRLQPRYLKSAALSVWKQGIRRLDRAYFGLLWGASKLDRGRRRWARQESRKLRRRLSKLRGDGEVWVHDDLAWIEEILGHAQDYLVRFRPETRLDQVREWVAGVQAQASVGRITAEDARTLYTNARRYLKVQLRRHRFPGVALARAMEAAIKGLHYEQVMHAVVAGEDRR